MKYDALVFIGRFQPFHNGHKAVIDAALKQAKEVIVVVGSSFASRNIRNPFTFQERKAMIESVYKDEVLLHNPTSYNDMSMSSRVKVVPVSDYPYDDNKWVRAVQNVVHGALSWSADPVRIGLIGHEKDGSSYYLKIFKPLGWGNVSVPNVDGINATDIRKHLFGGENVEVFNNHLPETVKDVIRKVFVDSSNTGRTPVYETLVAEHLMIRKYKKAWEAAPFPPTFMTVDAVVVQSGHILLVKRGDMPGKGLWALPGGFLNQGETMLDGAIRELKEETKIKVPVPVLKGSIKESKTFDAPNRSQRGRTITQAFYIDLGFAEELPKVKGSDDAEKAFWVPFHEVKQELMFEDHFHIIDHFVNIG